MGLLTNILNLFKTVTTMKNETIHQIIEEHCGAKLGDDLRWYLDTGETAQLKKNKTEAAKTWIHKSKAVRVPVLKVDKKFDIVENQKGKKLKAVVGFTTRITWSNVPGDGVEKDSKEFVGYYYSREWIPGLVKMAADEAVIAVWNYKTRQFEDHTVYFPEAFELDGRRMVKVSGMDEKGMYFEEGKEPFWISEFLKSTDPKAKNDLGTMLKRQGKVLDTLSNLGAYKEHSASSIFPEEVLRSIYSELGDDFDVLDWGTLVLNRHDWDKLSKEMGADVFSPYQSTIIGDNWYFKGAVTNERMTGMKPGYYGGVKKANKSIKIGKAILGSSFSVFTSEPWRASINRQICDYVPELPFPRQMEAPSMDDTIKAHMGLESKRIGYNYTVFSGIKNTLNKVNLSPDKSWAGKMSIINSADDCEFVIKGSTKRIKELSGKIIEMAMLIFPWLATYTHVPRVRVKFVYEKNVDNHLILANVNSANIKWICKWLMAFYGRDFDGDGIALTFDPRVLDYSTWDADHNDGWIDTTAVKKYMSKSRYNTPSEAIKAAEQMIKLGSKLIGKYDKTVRRMIYAVPVKVTPELRMYISLCIQMAISSQKKAVSPWIEIRGKKYNWKSTGWIYRAGFLTKLEYNSAFENNPHDAMDDLSDSISAYITSDIAYRKMERKFKNETATQIELDRAKKYAISCYKELRTNMGLIPDSHREVTEDIMSLVIKSRGADKEVAELKSMAESILLKYDGSDIEEQQEINALISEIRGLSMTVTRSTQTEDKKDDGNHGVSYEYVARVINHKLTTYKGNKEWLIAAVIKSVSAYLLGLMDLKWYTMIGYKLKVCIPSVKAGKIGSTVTKGQLMALQGAYRDLPDGNYKVLSVENMSSLQWFTKKKGDHKSCGYMITLKQV